jgi:hypothetical protein
MTTDQFANKVIDKFCKELTDLVFQYIENDAELKQDYQKFGSKKELHAVNQALGKKIKERFGVENLERSNQPKSNLIKSYTKHTL